MFQNVSECSRMFQNASRMFQNACKMFENACRMFQNVPECIHFHELACSYISLHFNACRMLHNVPECSIMHAECSRMFQNAGSYISLQAVMQACMELHELACSFLSLHELLWAYMKFHELACSFISLHVHLQFYELVCSSFLCLSSSQEFRSACWMTEHLKCLWGSVTSRNITLRYDGGQEKYPRNPFNATLA